MGSLCQCLFHFCCEGDDDSEYQRHEPVVEPMERDDDSQDEEGDGLMQGCHEESHGIHAMFRRIRGRWGGGGDHQYDIMRAGSEEDGKIPPSPLQPAKSFDSKGDIPTISPSEVVLPGSQIQKDMATLMANAKFTDDDVECVICLEGFDASNPRMPTMCGCGENATYFHLPCLYQWLEQSRDCPSCRTKLTWEEF